MLFMKTYFESDFSRNIFVLIYSTMPNSYSQTLQTNLSLSQVKPIAEEAIIAAGFRNSHWTTNKNILQAECPTTIWSWGEKIEVSFTTFESGTEISVRSKCRLPTQFLDWGKNKRNTDNFISALKRLINI